MTLVVADSSSSWCCHPTKPLVFAQCTVVCFASFLSGGSNDSTGKETGKTQTHLCAVQWCGRKYTIGNIICISDQNYFHNTGSPHIFKSIK